MDTLFTILVLVMSVVVHEVSHGYVALLLGDPTAKFSGRLTLNPLKHLDPFGSLILPALLALAGAPVFGWARPVPYNPYNLRAGSWGPALVGAAGPLSNLLIAAVFSLVFRAFSGSLFATPLLLVILVNLSLAVFNLMPVPPFDGSKLLFVLVPYRLQRVLEQNELILLVFAVLVLWQFVSPVVFVLFRIFTGVSI